MSDKRMNVLSEPHPDLRVKMKSWDYIAIHNDLLQVLRDLVLHAPEPAIEREYRDRVQGRRDLKPPPSRPSMRATTTWEG